MWERIMYFNRIYNCNYARAMLQSFFLLSLLMVPREVKAISWMSFDKAVFNIAIQTARYAISAGAKIVLNNPRIAAVALAIYYRNQIFNFAKDTTGSLVGEYPYISLLIVLGSLSYYSFLSCNNQDNQEQEADDTE